MSRPPFSTTAEANACPDALGQIWFGALPQPATPLPRLCVHAPLLRAAEGAGLGECWAPGGGATQTGTQQNIHYRHNDTALFGVLELKETDPAALATQSDALYRQIFALMAATGFPHLWRTWNYLPDIHAEPGGLERYRQFNLGRQAAFDAESRAAAQHAPAACALGVSPDAGVIQIAFLAGRRAPIRLENPRQTSAYHYPREYGPQSPTFSRATLVPLPDADLLLISGTASIVGHQSRHPGSVRAQTRETLANLSALLGEANAHRPEGFGFRLSQLAYRIYVRHPADTDAVARELAVCLGTGLNLSFVQADVCRQELLVEMEATGVLPRP
ncbi:hypothetical protein [Halothiobacillus sp. DCM-1]|uniref:chorismate transformation enzyme, FkbO/Hyg5 family n=1 Tax=Halothiobacillus sp. DCM-1 TaxID=3112558 RepID=UPI0032491AF4